MIKLSFNDKEANDNPEAKQWLSECEKKINDRLTEEVLNEFKNSCLVDTMHGLYIPNDENEKVRNVAMKDLYDFMDIKQ